MISEFWLGANSTAWSAAQPNDLKPEPETTRELMFWLVHPTRAFLQHDGQPRNIFLGRIEQKMPEPSPISTWDFDDPPARLPAILHLSANCEQI